jgi:hypothetical protein
MRRARQAVSWFASVALLMMFAGAAAGAKVGELRVELNKLEDQEGACRAYLVAENGIGADIAVLKIDFVLFDKDGIIAKRLAVNIAPLRLGKTALKAFDVEGLTCGDTGHILINDVIDCRVEEEQRDDCVTFLIPASRSNVKLIK